MAAPQAMSKDESRTVRRALAALAESLRDEAVAFEARAYGQPFLPKELSESKRLFGDHCRRIDSYLGFRDVRHFCWMSASGGEQGGEKLLLEYHQGKANGESSVRDFALLSRPATLLSKGMVWGLRSLAVTPRIFIPGDAVFIPYVVFRNEDVAGFLANGKINYEGLHGHFRQASALREFIYIDPIIVDQANASSTIAQLSNVINLRPRFFEAYHVMLGFAKGEIEELRDNEFVHEVLSLLSMQFHREWGNREQEMQAHREAQDARLRKASDLLSAFDDVLHSGLNTLRSLGSGLACQDFADGIPPKRLRYRLVPVLDLEESSSLSVKFDTAMESNLLDTLARCWRSEQATAAAMSLGRLLASRKILNNMRSGSDSNLSVPVAQAKSLLESYARGVNKSYSVTYDAEQLKRGQLPMGYVSVNLLSVFIYELLLNAFNHARIPVEMILWGGGDEEHLELTVSSPVQSGLKWVTEEGVTLPAGGPVSGRRRSFLFRFREVEHILQNGLGIQTRVIEVGGQDYYQAVLRLRELPTEDGSTVHPLWEAK